MSSTIFMRQSGFLLFVLIALYSGHVCADEICKTDLSFGITEKGLIVNDQQIGLTFPYKKAKIIFGEPDEIYSSKELVYKYNKFGMLLHQKGKSKDIAAITLYLREEEIPYMPYELFQGKIKLNGVELMSFVNKEALVELFPAFNFKEDGHFYLGVFSDIGVYLKFDAEDLLRYIKIDLVSNQS